MNDRKRKRLIILGAVIILVGIAGILYPFIGNWINSLRFRNAVNDYQEETDEIEDLESKRLLEEARAYNTRLFKRSGGTIRNLTEDEMEEYNSVLDLSVTTIMGYLDIPSIDVFLPIYHGTEEKVLQVGIGHLEGSSLPVGGENTHSVLTGHSGLPSKKLFTDLDQLEIGDTFTVTVLDAVLTYKVDDISVKLPEEVFLDIGGDRDEITLVTCTPIGANTHRLLVHAVRTEDEEPESNSD